MTISTFSRRRFVASSLAAATALHLKGPVFALSAGGVMLTPEQEVGPFYVADEMIRSKIAEGKAGVPLTVKFLVLDHATGQPLHNAAIDLWHCDALGLYSGFTTTSLGPPPEGGPDGGPGGPGAGQGPMGPPPGFDPGHSDPAHGPGSHGGQPGGPMNKPSDKFTFLRGIQLTGSDGSAVFETIYPGFYQGRVNHIHFKVRLDGHRQGKTYAAGHTSHTGQVFFPEDLSAQLMAHAPYSEHAIHRTTLAEDHVFGDEQGAQAVASVHAVDPAKPSAGLVAEFRAIVDPHANPAPVGMGPRG